VDTGPTTVIRVTPEPGPDVGRGTRTGSAERPVTF